LYRRQGIYYVHDHLTGKQQSLGTRSRTDALRLFAAKNEAHQQPVLNLQLARVYLTATDPSLAVRTWNDVVGEIIKTKRGSTQIRWEVARKDHAFDLIRSLTLLETRAEHFLRVLEKGTVATNVFLRRIHNFALDMNWLPCSLIPKRQWPAVVFKAKRAITLEEHRRIVERELNVERRLFYELCWHLGTSQSDLAHLTATDVDWANHVISYQRGKTGSPARLHFGSQVEATLRQLPAEGPLFPYLRTVRAGDRATEFKQRCRGLSIEGVSLHSYRYAWAERAKAAGYPERFAQEALGHNSKAVHRAYAKRAVVKVPSLEEYEEHSAQKRAIPFPISPDWLPASHPESGQPTGGRPHETPVSAPLAPAAALPLRHAG
jgi:integrase